MYKNLEAKAGVMIPKGRFKENMELVDDKDRDMTPDT